MKAMSQDEKDALTARFQGAIYGGNPALLEATLRLPVEERLALVGAWLEGSVYETGRWTLTGASGARAAERLFKFCSGPGMARGLAGMHAGEAAESMIDAGAPAEGLTALGYVVHVAVSHLGSRKALTALSHSPEAISNLDLPTGAQAAAENLIWFALEEPAAGEALRAIACQGLIRAGVGLLGEVGALRRGVLERAGGAMASFAESESLTARGAFECLGALAEREGEEALKKWLGWGAPFTDAAARGAFMSLGYEATQKGLDDESRRQRAIELMERLERAGVWKEGFAEAVGSDPRVFGPERSAVEEAALGAAAPGAGRASRPAPRV